MTIQNIEVKEGSVYVNIIDAPKNLKELIEQEAYLFDQAEKAAGEEVRFIEMDGDTAIFHFESLYAVEDTSEFEEKYIIQTNPTTKGIMYGVYASLQSPVCHETGEKIKAGDRFLFKDNFFYCANSKMYNKFEGSAALHNW